MARGHFVTLIEIGIDLIFIVIHNKSYALFQMIKDMKQQFSSLLRDIGFLDSTDPKATSANHNSGANLSCSSSRFFAVISFLSLLTTTTLYPSQRI